MNKQISEYKLRNAIKKTKEFKEFVCQYRERMKAFEHGHYDAVRIEYAFAFDFSIKYHNPDWEDSNKVANYKKWFEFDDTIITNYDFRDNPSEVLAKLIARHILDVIVLKDVEHYHIVDAIDASCLHWSICELWAWSDEKVGKYHIEQECGEVWIVMPKEPEVCMRNYINIYD